MYFVYLVRCIDTENGVLIVAHLGDFLLNKRRIEANTVAGKRWILEG